MRVESTPIQTLSANFDLQGDPTQGELALTSPLGTLLAQARWAPGAVEWRTVQESRQFASLEALSVQLTGTTLPLAALFDWLQGTATRTDGWEPDLREFAQGRISARRRQPAPEATLRVVLER